MSEIWESIYSRGQQLNRYPWDCVVSFLFEEASRRKCSIADMSVLELGCGTGSNLWFAAREGANVAGTDLSDSALRYAKNRFLEEQLEGRFDIAELPSLPEYEPGTFDVVIDRACLTSCPTAVSKLVLSKLNRLLSPDGRVFSTAYGKRHDSYEEAKVGPDGRVHDISKGSLIGVGGISFFSESEILELFSTSWRVELLLNRFDTVRISGQSENVEEWHVTASPVLE